MNKIEEIEDVEIEDNEDNEETLQAEFTWIDKEIKGKAYLIGNSKKATTDFIKAFTNSPAVPTKDKDRIEAELESKLIIDFSKMVKIKKPKTTADAYLMLGQATADKMVATKVETNKMDKERNKLSDKIVKDANMAELMGSLFT